MSEKDSLEALIPLSQLRFKLPVSARTGKAVHVSALIRWGRRGLKASDGSIVRLRVSKAGGSLCSSEAAVREFFDQLTKRSGLGSVAPRAELELTSTSEALKAVGLK